MAGTPPNRALLPADRTLADRGLADRGLAVRIRRLQEETRQRVILARLEEERLAAQQRVIQAERANELAKVEANRAVIEAQKANELIEARLDLEVQTVRAQAAAESAKVATSVDRALALLYSTNPGLLNFHIASKNAEALANTEKLLITPEGTTPTLIIPGEEVRPVVDVGGGSDAPPE